MGVVIKLVSYGRGLVCQGHKVCICRPAWAQRVSIIATRPDHRPERAERAAVRRVLRVTCGGGRRSAW